MDFLSDKFFLECCLKIFLSAAIGIVLGAERRNHLHAIGIRTMILITTSCALLGILSYYGAEHPAKAIGDPTRVAAGVVTGVGFLGGGVIMRQGLNVRGITTAAIIWTASALGLSLGYGLYAPSLALFLLVIAALPVFKKIEKALFPASKIKTFRLAYADGSADIQKIKAALTAFGIIARDVGYSRSFESQELKVEILANVPAAVDFSALEAELKKTGPLLSLSLSADG